MFLKPKSPFHISLPPTPSPSPSPLQTNDDAAAAEEEDEEEDEDDEEEYHTSHHTTRAVQFGLSTAQAGLLSPSPSPISGMKVSAKRRLLFF
jgi:hypothetical protein